jgi:hypothetical protein
VIPTKGEMYTVIPHRMYDGSKTGFQCGAFHCRVKGDAFDSHIKDGEWAGRRVVSVQEMKIDNGRWMPAMSTTISVDRLRPLAVDVDLFGNPAGGAR